MKQIAKTPEILGRLRAAFGPDANLDNLVVFEATAANTNPIRKAGGLFKGAKITPSTLAEMATSLNKESIPLQGQHDIGQLPMGRVFQGIMLGSELRVLFAIDGVTNPDIITKLDSGVIDQVSVGMLSKQMLCSTCSFDFLGTGNDAMNARWSLKDPKGHVVGEAGMHLIINGMDQFFELSLVGKGALEGARVVGPSDSAFAAQYPALAASMVTDGALALQITPELEDTDPMDVTAFTAQLTAAVTEKAHAVAQLTSMTSERDAANVALTAAQTALTTMTAERDAAVQASATATETQTKLTAAEASVTAATLALSTEATTILTACGKTPAEIDAAIKDKDATALLSVISEHREAFAAAVPVGGKANGADRPAAAAANRNGAFRSPPRN